MQTLYVIYGNRRRPFEARPEWKLLTFAGLEEACARPDVQDLTRQALADPIGTAGPLETCVPAGARVAVIVEDPTRASPKRLILEVLLDLLERAGVPAGNLDVVVALGTHRGLTSQEMTATFGADLLRRYRFRNHDCRADDLVAIGRLPSGRSVKINRVVHDADFRIGVGSIFPHPMNGFGGGGKILFPGVADFEAIREHHFQFTFHAGTGVGRLAGNVFYSQVRDLAQKGRLDWVINSVLDRSDQVAAVVAGDPVQAHLAGIEISRRIIGVPFARRADLTLITSFPYTEGPQIVKPLVTAAEVTKEGGTIILAADCSGNLPETFVEAFAAFHARYGGRLKAAVLEHFHGNRLIMEGGAVDFNVALGNTLAVQDRFDTILVSDDITAAQAQRMGFRYAADLEQAFDMAAVRHPAPDVHVIPSGGVILPLLPPEEE